MPNNGTPTSERLEPTRSGGHSREWSGGLASDEKRSAAPWEEDHARERRELEWIERVTTAVAALAEIDWGRAHYSAEDRAILAERDRPVEKPAEDHAPATGWFTVYVPRIPQVHRDLQDAITQQHLFRLGVARTPKQAAALDRRQQATLEILASQVRWDVGRDGRRSAKARQMAGSRPSPDDGGLRQRAALHRYAAELGMSYAEAKQFLLMEGLVLALDKFDRPAPIRVRGRPVRDAEGPVPLRLSDLPPHVAWGRVANEAIRQAQRLLREEDRAMRHPDRWFFTAYDRSESWPEWVRGGDEPDVEAELRPDEARGRLAVAWSVASPQTREILKLVADGLTIAEASRTLGIDPNQGQNQMSRLRRRLGVRSPGPRGKGG